MINPSAYGWVEKFFSEQNIQQENLIVNGYQFYENTRKTGFLAGYTTHFVTQKVIDTKGWTSEEFSKIGLLNILFGIFQLVLKSNDKDLFLKKCTDFYEELHPKSVKILSAILPQDSISSKLENNISSRIQTNENIISKNFSHILTNALLFMDVLAFKKYLQEDKISEKYLKKTEKIIINIISLALKTKLTKSKYDDLLQKLFESSVRYSKFNKIDVLSIDNINLNYFTDDFEKFYLIDMAGMAMWNDEKLESNEEAFLYQLAEKLNVSSKFVDLSIIDSVYFFSKNKETIPYFNYSNPVKHFYDHTTQHVQTLISRNKARLLLEISQSKELMKLLAQSTVRELDANEKKKVRNQLLDVCKTIPSLTIFIIPGGSLLLPILIKFIPQLLPSAFNENLRE